MLTEADIAVVNNRFDDFANKFTPRKSMSLDQAVDHWLKASKQVSDNKPKVIAAKRRLLTAFADQCSKAHLGAVERADVERFIRARNKCVSPTTASDELTRLRTFFRYCVAQDWITKNPCENIKGPKKSSSTKDYIHVVSAADLDMLKFKRPVYRHVCLALWHTGLRIEELYRVQLSDIHETMLHVRCDPTQRTKNAKGRQVQIGPKARKSLRTVSVLTLPHPETVRKVLKTACKRAGLAPMTPHQFRHSRASIWYAEGVPKKNISVLLGHSSTEITENYLHPIPKEMWLERSAQI